MFSVFLSALLIPVTLMIAPLYGDYLADAALLLASAERGANKEELKEKVERHERLLSQTWLAGPEHEVIFKAWKKVKNAL